MHKIFTDFMKTFLLHTAVVRPGNMQAEVKGVGGISPCFALVYHLYVPHYVWKVEI